jgi:hypothetical protein
MRPRGHNSVGSLGVSAASLALQKGLLLKLTHGSILFKQVHRIQCAAGNPG